MGVLVAALGFGATLGCCVFSAPRYRGPPTAHFDGKRFRNLSGRGTGRTGDFFKWMTHRELGPWREWTDAEPGPPPPQRVGKGQLRVTFVNHATALIQMDEVNILTDPIWSERASPVSFAGPRRVRPPGIKFEDLPPIDAVLVSHNHYDHLDVPTLRRLAREHRPHIVSGLGNKALFDSKGVAGATELGWWQSVAIKPGVRVSAVPAEHFSSRGLCDSDRTLWAGFVVEGEAGGVYFAGDTGQGPHFEQIRERLGPIRLALLPIGAFRPEWFMGPVHLSPVQAVQAHRTLEAGTSVGIHFGTFRLADDGEDEAPNLLAEARGDARFWLLGFGESREVP
ncbi:MAG: MBL fold metallo-hydrolase [Myxococcales bacterium]|nr:MBL fold metallo-hydrolase [Myxococcales bacterium]